MRISFLSLVSVLLYAYYTAFSILYLKRPAFGASAFLAFASALFILAFFNKMPTRWIFEAKISILLLMSMAGALALQHVVYLDQVDVNGVSAHGFGRSVFVMIVFWFFAGCAVSRAYVKQSSFFSLVLLAPLFILVIPSLNQALLIGYDVLGEDGFLGVNHLLLVEMMLLVGFLSYSLANGRVAWLVVLAVGFLAYSGGGRTAFFLGVLILLFFQLLLGAKADRVFVVLLLVITFIAYISLDLYLLDQGVGRMLMSSGALMDESLIARVELFERGVGGLFDQFAIGGVSQLVRANGGVGTYIHNVLSAWQFFGFGAFALVVVLVSLLVVAVRKEFALKDVASPMDIFGLLCFVYGVLGILLSKFIGFSFLWFSLGFWVWRLQSAKFSPVR